MGDDAYRDQKMLGFVSHDNELGFFSANGGFGMGE